MINLNEIITDHNTFYVMRDGFVFMTSLTESAHVFDTILIKELKTNTQKHLPAPLVLKIPCVHSLEEHIDFINKHQLEKPIL